MSDDRFTGPDTRTQVDSDGPGSSLLPELGELSPGEVIADRYVVDGLFGRGGFGDVYRVRDKHEAGKPVALKLQRIDHADRVSIRALRAEFALLSSLKHPSLVPVFDFGVLDERYAYLTQAIAVGERLDRVPLDLGSPRGIHLVAQLCSAIDYLHSRGILHGDIKPANILVDLEREELRLLDFGIARGLGSADVLTRQGTTGYMSPEAIRGSPCDARSDLYSLGVTLYRVVGGRPPFDGSATEVWTAHLLREPPALGVRGLSARADAAILRLMAKDPGNRFASAAELLIELAAAAGVSAPKETGQALASYVLSPKLVGYDGVVERIAGTEAMCDVVLIEGDAGSGKSRIVRELRQRLVLDGRSYIHVTAHRYESPDAFFQTLAAAIVSPAIGVLLEEDDRIELSRSLPSLLGPGEKIAIALDPERARQFRVLALARALKSRMRDTPGVLVFGDLHFASTQVVRLVWDLVQAIQREECHCRTVITCRYTPELAELADKIGAQRLKTRELKEVEALQLIDSMFGEAEFLQSANLALSLAGRRHSPLWLQESLRSALERGLIRREAGSWKLHGDIAAESLEAVLSRRIDALDPNTFEVAVALAVLERRSTVVDVAAVLERRITAIVVAVRELLSSRDERLDRVLDENKELYQRLG